MRPKTARGLSVVLAWVVLLLLVLLIGLIAVYFRWAWPSVPAMILGVVIATLALFGLPRPNRLPVGSVVLARGECPHLWELLDEIADEVTAPRFEVLACNDHFNAMTFRLGFRRRRVLVLGLLLWEAITPSERVAVLAHEAGHEANGDPRRSAVVGQSLDTLANWHQLMHPGPWSLGGEPRFQGIADQVAWAAQRVLVMPVELLYRVQLKLTLIDHRQSEFAADVLSAQVSGSAAARDALRATTCETSVLLAIERARRDKSDLWQAVHASIGCLEDDVKASYLKQASETQSRVDSTHPPTADRLVALEAATHEAIVVLDAARQQQIASELEAARKVIGRRLLGHEPTL